MGMLQRWLHRRDALVAAFCFDLLWRHQRLSMGDVAALARRCRHPWVARRAMQVLAGMTTPLAQDALTTVAVQSRHGPVRVAAWRVLQSRMSGATDELAKASLRTLAEQALCDNNGTVRVLALRLYGVDRMPALRHASNVLQAPDSAPPVRAGALALLGELGLVEGEALVCDGLNDPLPALRRAAYGSAFKLKMRAPQALLLQAMDDPAPSVFTTVRRWAVRLGVSPTAAELAPWMTGDDARAWQRALQLLALGDPWSRLQVLLELPPALLADGDSQGFTDLATQWLTDMRSCFVQPSVAQRARIASLLTDKGVAVFAPMQRRLNYRLEGFGLAPPAPAGPSWGWGRWGF